MLDEALDAQVGGGEPTASTSRFRSTCRQPDTYAPRPAQPDPGAPPQRDLAGRGASPVEVTETAAIDLLQAVSLLGPLHDHGVRISIDDFGTGYTSLAALPDLPLDELKVDQQFVLRSMSSPADDAIVRTVRGLAHRLGLDAVAEGVETGEIFERMRNYGFDLLQGYFLAKPLSESDLIAFARSSNAETPRNHVLARE